MHLVHQFATLGHLEGETEHSTRVDCKAERLLIRRLAMSFKSSFVSVWKIHPHTSSQNSFKHGPHDRWQAHLAKVVVILMHGHPDDEHMGERDGCIDCSKSNLGKLLTAFQPVSMMSLRSLLASRRTDSFVQTEALTSPKCFARHMLPTARLFQQS